MQYTNVGVGRVMQPGSLCVADARTMGCTAYVYIHFQLKKGWGLSRLL